MQSIFGFVPDRGLRPVDHRIGYLLAAMRREAMEEGGVRCGQRHHPVVDLERGKGLLPDLVVLLPGGRGKSAKRIALPVGKQVVTLVGKDGTQTKATVNVVEGAVAKAGS